MDTHRQAKALIDSIGNDTGSPVSWEVGKVVNALIKQAQEDCADNPVIAELGQLRQQGVAGTTKGVAYADIRAIVGQIIEATKPAPAAPVAVVSGRRAPERF
jgi:hypothetical protein